MLYYFVKLLGCCLLASAVGNTLSVSSEFNRCKLLCEVLSFRYNSTNLLLAIERRYFFYLAETLSLKSLE